MKRTVLFSLGLALSLAFAPAAARAAGVALPAGSGYDLYSNGAAIIIDTKANLPGAGSAMRAALGEFTAGDDEPESTVAYWTVTDDGDVTTTYYVPLRPETVVYAGGFADMAQNARVTMKGGAIDALVLGGKSGTVTNANVTMTGGAVSTVTVGGGGTLDGQADLAINGGTQGGIALGAGLSGAEVSLDAAGQTVGMSGDVSLKSLSIKPGTILEVPSGSGNSLTAETVEVRGTLRNNGIVAADQVSAGNSGIINNEGGATIAAAVQIGPGGAFTNKGDLAGDLSSQGTVNLDGGAVSGDIQSSGTVAGAKKLTIAAGQSLTVTGGTVEPAIENNGTVNIQGGAVSGKLINEGALHVNGGAVNGKVTNSSGKTMRVTGGAVSAVDNYGGTLEVSASGRINGNVYNKAGGALNVNAGGAISGAVNNEGDLTMEGGALDGTLDNNGTLTLSGGAVGAAVTNTKTMAVSGGAVSGKLINESAGTVALSAGGNLTGDIENRKGGSILGSALTIAPGRTMTNAGVLSADTITVNGTLVNASGGAVAQDSLLINGSTGTVRNAGTIAAGVENRSGGRIFNEGLISGAPLTNAGSLTNQNKGQISSAEVINSGSLLNENGGSVTNAASIVNTGTVTNNGTVASKVANGKNGKLINSKTITGAVTNGSGGAITNDGVLSGSLTNESGGSVFNGGTISGAVSNKGVIKNTSESASVTGKVTGNEVQSFDSTITAANADGTITLSKMPAGSVLTATSLSESSAGYKALKEAAKNAKVICAYDISCNKTFTGEKTLAFSLGAEYASKTITGLHYINGIVSKHEAKADSGGRFSMPVESLSPFMLVTGSGTGAKVIPVKTGDQGHIGAGLTLILLAAGLYIRRKRAT